MRKVIFLLALFAAQHPYAQTADSTTQVLCYGGELNLYKTEGAFVTIAILNNQAAGIYLLDSGASFSVIDCSVADKLKLPVHQVVAKYVRTFERAREEVTEFDGSSIHSFMLTDGDNLLVFNDSMDVFIADISSLSYGSGIKISGILGLDFLQKFKAVIDFEGLKFYVKPESR